MVSICLPCPELTIFWSEAVLEYLPQQSRASTLPQKIYETPAKIPNYRLYLD
jgi:hypothetical protein